MMVRKNENVLWVRMKLTLLLFGWASFRLALCGDLPKLNLVGGKRYLGDVDFDRVYCRVFKLKQNYYLNIIFSQVPLRFLIARSWT